MTPQTPQDVPDARVSRRNFLGKAGAAVAGMTVASPILSIAQTPDEPFRITLIGCGGRMNALLGTILKQENVEVVACVDIIPKNLNRTLDRIEKITRRRPEGFTGEMDYKSVLARDDVQGAFNATPCDLHAVISLKSLELDKHMYGENPMCLTMDEAHALKAAQQKSQAILQIGFQRRVNPRYIDGVQTIKDGELGDIMEGRAAWNNTGGPLGVGRWLNYRARSGDWMLEQATHTWDVLAWVTGGPPIAVYGAGRRDVFKAQAPDRDVTDFYIATLEYPKGLLVNYNHTWSAPRNDRGAFSGVYERISGPKGGIDLGAGRISYTDNAKEPKLLHERVEDMTALSVRHFFECVREGRQPASGVDNGEIATQTGLLVRQAVDARARVTLDDIVSG